MSESKSKKGKKTKKGKGKGLNEVTSKKGKKLDEEDNSPFAQFKNQYLKTLRSNRVT
jgi:hypothetical protein